MTATLTPRDVDLLQAAFDPRAAAAIAWNRWRDSIDWDGPVEPLGFALLPRVCRNLEALGIDDPLFPRFKGIARQAWVANQRFKGSIGEWVSAIPSVDFMALPPTSLLFSDSTAIRNSGRWCHLAVHPEQAASAIHGLLRCGWRTSGLRLPDSVLEGYALGAGHIPLERDGADVLTLTWRLDPWFAEHAKDVWDDSESVALGNHAIRCLCRTDALLFMLRQPVGDDPFRWVSDVLSLSSPTIDWSRVMRALSVRPLDHDCSALLPTVSRFLDAGNSPASSWQWPFAPAGRVPATRSVGPWWRRCRQDWATYRAAWGSEYRLTTALLQLPGYLMGRWRLPALTGLPRGLARWLCRRDVG